MALRKRNGAKPAANSGENLREIQEELAYLRHQCNSLQIRGHYAECMKTIEENLAFFYTRERWPEQFFSMLRLHQKCYPSLRKDQPHDEYMEPLFRKQGIPFAFARLLRLPDAAIAWTADHFLERARKCEENGELDLALSYCDIILKIKPGGSDIYLHKSHLYDLMDKSVQSLAMIEQALELSPSNHHALGTLARHFAAKEPQKALEYVEKAIEQSPGDPANYLLKSEVLHLSGDLEGALSALEPALENDPYNTELPYQKGELFLAMDKQGSAIPQYRLAIALDDKHVPSLMRLAEASKEKNPDVALEYISTVASVQPENVAASLLRAQLLHRLGEFQAAILQYKSHLQLDPSSHEAMFGLGELFLRERNADIALPYLEQAVEIAPGNTGYRMKKAGALIRLENLPEAEAEYRAVLDLDNKIPNAWAGLGGLAITRSPKEALDYYNKASALAPENPDFLSAKGELLLQISPDQPTAALELLDQACSRDPGNAELHLKLAMLLEATENYTSSMEHYKVSLNLDPNQADAHYRYARLLAETDPGGALLHITSAISLSVGSGEYYRCKSRLLERVSGDEEALAVVRDASSHFAEEPEVYREFSELLDGAGIQLAMLYINRAIELEPDNPAYLCARAHMFFRSGQKSKALEQYERLLKKNPDQHEALFGIARILAAKKDKKALDYFDRALRLAPQIHEYHAEKAAYIAPMEDRYEEAVQEYSAAIELNKLAWSVILEKARLLDSHDDLPSAMNEYRRALLVNRNCKESAGRIGAMLVEYSPQNALLYLDQAIRLDPENHLHHAYKSSALYYLEQPDEAAAHCLRAIELGEQTDALYYELASILAGSAPEAAMVYCRMAVESTPGKAEYHLLLGVLHKTLAAYSAARQEYERAAELDQKSHEAMERMAELSLLEKNPDSLERADLALDSRPGCATCLVMKARILSELGKNHAGALACIEQALEQRPGNLEYQELLVEVLQRKRSFLRIIVEKRKLDKLRKELEEALDVPEPPSAEQDRAATAPAPPERPEDEPETQPPSNASS